MATKPVKVLADLQTRKEILKLDNVGNILFKVSGSLGNGVVLVELPMTASAGISARLYGTASYALNAATASYAENAGGLSAVYTSGNIAGSGTQANPIYLQDPLIIGAVTASSGFSGRLYGTSSYALTASYAQNAGSGLSSIYTSGSITGSGIETNPVYLKDPLVINQITASVGFSGTLYGTSSHALTASYAQSTNLNALSIQNAYNSLRYQKIDFFDINGSAIVELPTTSSSGKTAFTSASFNYIDIFVVTKEEDRWVNDLLSVQAYTSSNKVLVEIYAPSLDNTNKYKLTAINNNPDDFLVS